MKKKILLGICGIGNGHMNRQRLIIEQLLGYNIELVLAMPVNMCELIKQIFPQLKVISVNVPWIYCNNQGIDFKSTKERYELDGIDQFSDFLRFATEVQEIFEGENPDLVLSDYEPNVAQFAYATDIPLICLDQHSKFLNMPQKMINEYSINIEKSRLLFFFPRADSRYVSSFFQIERSEKYNIEVLPPIVKKIKRADVIKEKKVLVYFSTYSKELSQYIKILDLIKNYDKYSFFIYTELKFEEYTKYPNLSFEKISDEFDRDLQDCNFIISSAGHQLISEAINLEIPLYIFPLDTYDQNYCSYVVDKNGLGREMTLFDTKEFEEFLANVDLYRENIKEYKRKYWTDEWNRVLFEKLENKWGLEHRN